MSKQIVSTLNAPAAVGPYSQAVKAGDWLFVSGQIPLDADTGELLKGSVAEQTRKVLENLKAVLTAGGANLDQVVKCTCFLLDMSAFGEMNEVYAEFFQGGPPARAAVQVGALPKGADVEIEAIAYLGG